MLRKTTVLAIVGAFAALALAASASASWKHHGTPIQANAKSGYRSMKSARRLAG